MWRKGGEGERLGWDYIWRHSGGGAVLSHPHRVLLLHGLTESTAKQQQSGASRDLVLEDHQLHKDFDLKIHLCLAMRSARPNEGKDQS